MKKLKNIFWFGGVICLIGGYLFFLNYYHHIDTGEAPSITFNQQRIEISVKSPQSALLDGVKAIDKEDGDLSQEIFIESISPFDGNRDRTVTYAVFDSNQHVTKAVRKIHYTDYVKPHISLNKALISNEMASNKIYTSIGASSCVDGDISSQVTIQLQPSAENNDVHINTTVKDSTGTTEALDLIYKYDRNIYTTDIILKKYLVYIKTGEKFDAKKNIEEINSRTEKKKPMKYLDIDNQINAEVPGVYEVIYSFNNNGDNGLTKCVVVVEENADKGGTNNES